MTDFGRVFRMTVENDKGITRSEGTFMVIGLSSDPMVRALKKSYRQTICLAGSGYWFANLPIAPGELVPVLIDEPRIEWLDDE